MSWRSVKQFISISCYSLSGVSLYYLINSEKLKAVHNSWTTNYKPSIEWDSNWDFRAPTSLVKPIPENASPEKENSYNEKLEKHKVKAIRNIILIRHGQYFLRHDATDKDRILTQLGREQAQMTGERLKELQIPIDEFITSTMTRAKETGKIVLEALPNPESIKVKECSLIEEGAPIPPEPKVGHWKPQQYFFVDGARIEAAFREYFHRAEPTQEKDSYTILVCHANVIRYFVCRALQFPPEAWLRISLHHSSITWLSIHPSGRVTLRLLGDCGHIPKKSLSTRNV